MTDRELLEAAAKAAGIVVIRSRLNDPLQRNMLVCNAVRNFGQESGPWNPLADDGDALRLAVKLGLVVDAGTHHASAGMGQWSAHPGGRNPHAATRRAIVRAAAELASS